MKKILITGTTGYIAVNLKNWLETKPNDFIVDMLSVREKDWMNFEFGKYDTIIHTAAIVHSNDKISIDYELINVDLTKEIAQRAKQSGVKHFIFYSTMGVYGVDSGYINDETKPDPKTDYAKSKLRAEKILQSLVSDNFKVTILRPPLVYGENCPGNYQRLADVSKKTFMFPK